MSRRENADTRIHLAVCLYDCIQDCDISGLNILFKHQDADPNVIMPQWNFTPFHAAAASENEDFAVEAISIFLKRSGDPNVRADEQLTPVHIAASWGRAKALKVLIAGGGDPWLKDSDNKDSLDYAYENEHTDVIEILEDCSMQEMFSGNETLQNLYKRLHSLRTTGKTQSNYSCVSTNNRVRSSVKKEDTEPTENISDSDHSIVALEEILSINSKGQNSQSELLCNLDSLQGNITVSAYGTSSPSAASSPGVNTCENSDETRNSREQTSSSIEKSSVTRGNEALAPCDSDSLCSFITHERCFEESAARNTCRQSRTSLARQILMRPAFIVPEIVVINESSDVTWESSACSSGEAAGEDDKPYFSKSLTTSMCKEKLVEDWINNPSLSVPTASASSDQSYKSCQDDVNGTDFHNTAAVGAILEADSSCSDSVASFATVSECFKYTDNSEGIVLLEERWPGANYVQFTCGLQTDLSSCGETIQTDTKTCNTESLRKELEYHGITYGPITTTTKKVYLKQLSRQKKHNRRPNTEDYSYSHEVCRSLHDTNSMYFLKHGSLLEEIMAAEFARTNPTSRWREGHFKTSFTYLLLDPCITDNLPCRAQTLSALQVWAVFLRSIFYIGKGKRSRPYAHLYEAVQKYHTNKIRHACPKVKRIVKIWEDERGVICLHIFQNVIPVEAYTREAAMIDAIGLTNLTNIKKGEYYGKAARWSFSDKRIFGTYLLHKSLQIFLSEGERQLRPCDVTSVPEHSNINN